MSKSGSAKCLQEITSAIAGSWDGKLDFLGEWQDRSDVYEPLYHDYISTTSTLNEQSHDHEIAIAFHERIIEVFREGLLDVTGDFTHYRKCYVKASQFDSLQKIASILDFLLYLYQVKLVTFAKRLFFLSLIHLVKYLITLWGSQLEVFWEYMESREDLIIGHICQALVVQDRIDMLEMCNLITDYYHDKLDTSAETESLRDTLKFKVRSYISRALLFLDKTGLNNSYSGAGRSLPQLTLSDRFVVDFYTTQEMMNDPQKWIRMTPGKRVDMVFDNMYRLVSHLCDHPSSDDLDSATIADLTFMIPYLPFSIWDIYGDKNYNANAIYDLIDRPGFCLQFITQVVIFMKRLLGGKENSMGLDVRITPAMEKRSLRMLDVCSKFLRSTYPHYKKLLDDYLQSEYTWWSWLQNGKDKTGKALIPCTEMGVLEGFSDIDNSHFSENLESSQSQRIYITRTLTKIMTATTTIETFVSGKHGIGMSEKENQDSNSSTAAANSTDSDILYEKNTALWKSLRSSRGENFLLLTSKLGTHNLCNLSDRVNLYDLEQDESGIDEESQGEEKTTEKDIACGKEEDKEEKFDHPDYTSAAAGEEDLLITGDNTSGVDYKKDFSPYNHGGESRDGKDAESENDNVEKPHLTEAGDDAVYENVELFAESTSRVEDVSNAESNMSSLSSVESTDSQSLEAAFKFDEQSDRKRRRDDADSDDEPPHKRHAPE